MPELQSEVPTDDELRRYLEASLNRSGISLLSGLPENQTHYHPEVVESLAFLSSSPVCARFVDSAANTLLTSLQRLNRVPRDDSFWERTNRRPTIFKLTDFGERVLREDPNDVLALLTRAVLNIVFTGEFGLSLWVQLYRLNAVDLEYVAFAALLLEVGGSPTSEEFAQFLKETANASKADELLLPVREHGGKFLGQWNDAVRGALR
jgi:hypothetical protein